MPRGPRLDACGVLHHVMVGGIERRAIFRDDRDRREFVGRLAALTRPEAWTVYACALLANHVHLPVPTGRRPMARAMRALLTGYGGAFRRRHKRHVEGKGTFYTLDGGQPPEVGSGDAARPQPRCPRHFRPLIARGSVTPVARLPHPRRAGSAPGPRR